jgi:nuclear transport factor 2 (NTF2) superfamily protein
MTTPIIKPPFISETATTKVKTAENDSNTRARIRKYPNSSESIESGVQKEQFSVKALNIL